MQSVGKKWLGQTTHFIFSQTPGGEWDISGNSWALPWQTFADDK